MQVPQDTSAETREILKELEAEGKGTPAAEEPKKEEPKAEPEKVVEPDKADPPKPAKVEREERFVPVGKHNEERHKRQEAEAKAAEALARAQDLEAKLAATTNKPVSDTIDIKAKRLAEKHGIDEEFAKDLLAEASPSSALPPDLLNDLKAVKELRAAEEARAREHQQESGFEREFAEVAKEFPELANRKDDLKQLAFSEGNQNTSLRRLAIEFQHDNPSKPGRKTAETPMQGRKEVGDVIEFENMTEEQCKELDGEQFDKYVEWLGKKKK